MGIDLHSMPEAMRRCIAPTERAQIGPAAHTISDAVAAAEPKAEKELQKQIAGYLATRDIFFGQQRMDRKSTMVLGWPDFVFCYKGHFIALEAKTPVGKQEPEQVIAEAKIEAQGGRYYVVRSLVEVAAILNALEP